MYTLSWVQDGKSYEVTNNSRVIMRMVYEDLVELPDVTEAELSDDVGAICVMQRIPSPLN